MTYSNLTSSWTELGAAITATLGDMGYVHNPKTMSFNQYLATALSGLSGAPVSHLTSSRAKLLAGIANLLEAGPASHLTTKTGDLMEMVANAGDYGSMSSMSGDADFLTQTYTLTKDYPEAANLPVVPNVEPYAATTTVALEKMFIQDPSWGVFDPAKVIVPTKGLTDPTGSFANIAFNRNISNFFRHRGVKLTVSFNKGSTGNIFFQATDDHFVNKSIANSLDATTNACGIILPDGSTFIHNGNVPNGRYSTIMTFKADEMTMSLAGAPPTVVPMPSGALNAAPLKLVFRVSGAGVVVTRIRFVSPIA